MSEATSKSSCPKCGGPGKRVWTRVKIFLTSYFKEGYDPGLGKTFSSDRQRQEYLAREKPNLKLMTRRPRGVIVEKV